MIKNLCVLNSDQVNKYGFRFSIEALEGALHQNATTGVPMHLSHDMHKPIGWMMPFGLHFQPGLVRSLAVSMMPESEEEGKTVSQAKRNYAMGLVKDEIEKYSDKILPLVKDFASADYKFINAGAFAIVDKDIAERAFPKLIDYARKDKNGLIDISLLEEDFIYKAQGVFFHKKLPLCLFAHPFFRKSLSRQNNFHFFFLDALIKLSKKPLVKTKILLDLDMIGYSPSYLDSFELEYWYGPKYSDDISTIQPGLTRHQASETERMYHGISSTEFFWKINGEQHEFELEELKEDEAPTLVDTYGCRYIHSIYKHDQNSFDHFDGAIRSYDPELYMERIGMKMTEFGRRSQYKKLFRVDGQLELKDWKNLATHYLQGNPLIQEYFGENKPEVSLPLPLANQTAKEMFVPFSIDKNDGVRLMVSYFQKNENFTDSHSVSICDLMQIGDESKEIIEYDIIEVKKALNRLGADLTIPQDVLFSYAKDLYWNIPCIFHGHSDPEIDISLTLQALKNLIDALIIKKREKVIAFTLAWNVDIHEIRLSVLGHVNDLAKWLTQSIKIPTTRPDFIQWLEKQSNFLNKEVSENVDKPALGSIVQFDGVLYIKRKIVGGEFKPEYLMEDDAMVVAIEIPPDKKDLYNELVKNNIRPVLAATIKRKTCLKSNQNYWDSPHSRILDDDIITSIDDIDNVFAFWSDKGYQ